MKKWKIPHTLVILVLLVVLISGLSYVVPAGVYDTIEVNGVSQVDPESFHYVESTPISPWRVVTSIPAGLQKNASIIFFILLVGGAIQIINATEIVGAALNVVLKKLGNKGLMAVPLFMIFFGLVSSVGINSAMLSFVPIGLMIAKAMGLDALVGVAIVMMGVCCGWSAGPFSTQTTGIAQELIGLPYLSGMGYRTLIMVLFFAFNSYMIYSYSKKIKADPTKSLVYGTSAVFEDAKELPEMTGRRVLGLITFAIGFLVVIYGAVNGWNMGTDIAGVFLLTGLAVGLVCGLTIDEIITEFGVGLKGIVFGVVIVGFAGAVNVVLSEANLTYTFVHAVSTMIDGLPGVFSVAAMYVFQIITNIFIPAGQAQAVATIPITSALGYVLGINQQVVVLCYNLGDGITNQIIPTAATIMASIGIAKVDYTTWCKFIWKWIAGMLLIGLVMIEIAYLMNWGPF